MMTPIMSDLSRQLCKRFARLRVIEDQESVTLDELNEEVRVIAEIIRQRDGVNPPERKARRVRGVGHTPNTNEVSP